jgi:TonB-linked SusC/RagA family outer membrane protein
MARLNYRYKDRYLLTLTARRDGSSVFAEHYKYATFPSVAFSWVASDESFLKRVDVLNLLKLRLSYGAVGNQAISPYQSLSLDTTTNYVFGDGGPSSLGIYPSNISNENLKWETTYMTNIGVDFSLFNGRAGGTIEVYNMDTRNLLVQRALPIMTGYTSVWTNLGQVNNKGIELSLNTVNVKTKDFEWSTNFVFSRNINKIVHLYGADADGDGKEDNDIGNGWFIGKPVKAFYDYVFDGIYQKGDILPAGYLPGFARFRDLNGDGKVEAAHDRTIVGQADPKIRWGLTNSFSYKNFQLSVFINAMTGWIGVFNQMDYYYGSLDPIRPANMFDSDWWTEANPSTTRPSLQYNRSTLGHNWYASRDFIRIQDVSLSYNFPSRILARYKLSNLSIYVSGKNLKTFTDWPGTNPETITSFPIARSVAAGFRLGF